MKYKLLINGKWTESSETRGVLNPFDGSLVGEVFLAGEREMGDAISAAGKAFESTRRLPSYTRAELIQRVVTRLRERKEELSRMMTLESGKPIQFTRGEVDRAMMTFTIAAEEAKRIPGEVVPLDLAIGSERRWGVVRRYPIGPIASITPFNFPLNLVAHKVAPALAVGNTVIHKSPPQTPITSVLLGEILMDSGITDGAMNIIACSNEIAEKLTADPRVKMLSFTGSPRVGWHLKAKSPMKKVLLELGGNAAVVVEPDANLDFAIRRLAVGSFANAGQICISVQRIYVHEKIYDTFRDSFVDETRQMKMGDPLDEDTVVGPMISSSEADRAFAQEF